MKRRWRAAATAAGFALAVIGCLDALAPGKASHFSTRLVIAPEFLGNQDSVEAPLDIDSIDIVVTRPPDTAVVAHVGVNVETAGDTIAIPVDVPLIGGETAYHIEFRALSEGAPLYAGGQDLTVTAMPSTPTSVVAVYVGPARDIRTVTISPAAFELALGDSVALTWSGVDSSGNSIPRDSIPARFASSDTAVARVGARGMVRGIAVGTARIVLTSVASTSIRDTAVVTVTAGGPSLASLTVTPGYQVMLLGDTVTLAVLGKDTQGGTAVPDGLTFTARSGVVAVSAAGLVTAQDAGSTVVVAQAPGATGTVADSMLVVVPASGTTVVSALGDARAFDGAKAGDTVRVVVEASLRAVPGEMLGSYNAQLTWNPAILSYVRWDPMPGGFGAPTVNETLTSTGQLRFGAADPNGKSGTMALVGITFVAAGTGAGGLQFTLTDLSAAITFTNLLPGAVLVPGTITIR